MTDKTLEAPDMLEQVDQTITSILAGGQSYQVGSRQLTRANLSTVLALRNELAAQKEAGTAPGLFDRTAVAFFDGR